MDVGVGAGRHAGRSEWPLRSKAARVRRRRIDWTVAAAAGARVGRLHRPACALRVPVVRDRRLPDIGQSVQRRPTDFPAGHHVRRHDLCADFRRSRSFGRLELRLFRSSRGDVDHCRLGADAGALRRRSRRSRDRPHQWPALHLRSTAVPDRHPRYAEHRARRRAHHDQRPAGDGERPQRRCGRTF